VSFDELGIKKLSEEEGPVALGSANVYRLQPRLIERKQENCLLSSFSTLEADFPR
jgi:hypothetical protein